MRFTTKLEIEVRQSAIFSIKTLHYDCCLVYLHELLMIKYFYFKVEF